MKRLSSKARGYIRRNMKREHSNATCTYWRIFLPPIGSIEQGFNGYTKREIGGRLIALAEAELSADDRAEFEETIRLFEREREGKNDD